MCFVLDMARFVVGLNVALVEPGLAALDASPFLWLPFGIDAAVIVLTAVLYPYVYVLGRSAFLGQSRQAIESARSLVFYLFTASA